MPQADWDGQPWELELEERNEYRFKPDPYA